MASEVSPLHEKPVPSIRRVVTGPVGKGSAAVVFDGPSPRPSAFRHIPGMVSQLLWATKSVPSLPFDGVDPTLSVQSVVPKPGETRLLVVTFPPDSVFAASDFDSAAAASENISINPGLAQLFEPDGMHTTETVDYGIVLDGEIWLELDEGRMTCLRRPDVVVQNGTRHAWRNKTARPATVAFVLVGAHRTR